MSRSNTKSSAKKSASSFKSAKFPDENGYKAAHDEILKDKRVLDGTKIAHTRLSRNMALIVEKYNKKFEDDTDEIDLEKLSIVTEGRFCQKLPDYDPELVGAKLAFPEPLDRRFTLPDADYTGVEEPSDGEDLDGKDENEDEEDNTDGELDDTDDSDNEEDEAVEAPTSSRSFNNMGARARSNGNPSPRTPAQSDKHLAMEVLKQQGQKELNPSLLAMKRFSAKCKANASSSSSPNVSFASSSYGSAPGSPRKMMKLDSSSLPSSPRKELIIMTAPSHTYSRLHRSVAPPNSPSGSAVAVDRMTSMMSTRCHIFSPAKSRGNGK